MDDLTHMWRPRQYVRPLAIGLITHANKLLVAAVTHDDGTRKGWRPLGGGIRFGERAEAALRREITEEIGGTLGPLRQLGFLENLFEHHGEQGHELVAIFHGVLIFPGQARERRFVLQDDHFRSEAAWIPIPDFSERRERLLPTGLIDWLKPLAPD